MPLQRMPRKREGEKRRLEISVDGRWLEICVDGSAFSRTGFISVLVGLASVLGIFKGNTKIAKSREINFFILRPHNMNLRPFSVWADNPTAEPHQPGLGQGEFS